METFVLSLVIAVLAISCVLFLVILRSMRGELRDSSAVHLGEEQALDITSLPPGMAPRLKSVSDGSVTPNAGFER
jgi:hypothetical protein